MLLLLEQLLAEGHTRSHKLCDSSLYDTLCKLRVLKLVTDCHLIACTHKFRKICLKGMMWESRHWDSSRSRAGTLCENDAKNLACHKRIVSICFIKIAAPEQKHCLWILRLEGEELLHHRGLGRFLFCHYIVCYLIYFGPGPATKTTSFLARQIYSFLLEHKTGGLQVSVIQHLNHTSVLPSGGTDNIRSN